ncbi:hypothetical protein B0H19DRAFT_1146765 [Mycena capillaripes]|nr:hypothetical protein B0H19DRAFT_1146765 [Mycena capillaripes]
MCTSSSAVASQFTTRRSLKERQSDASIATPTYRDGPQCCHCGWRGNHCATCPFYNPATCTSRARSPL